MHKKGIRRVAWVENPTNLQAVLNVGFINPTYAVVTWRSVSLFYAFHYKGEEKNSLSLYSARLSKRLD
jgi:hypothetical protein